MVNFRLINPFIEGEMKILYSGKSPISVANNVWEKVSEYITNDVPQFAFTLENVNDNSLYHFLVEEKITNNKVDYKITEMDIKNTDAEISAFRNKLDSLKKQHGGKRYRKTNDDDDSDSDSDDYDSKMSHLKADYEKLKMKTNPLQPISYWWYNPMLYNLDNIYIPTFVYPLMPYVELQLTTRIIN